MTTKEKRNLAEKVAGLPLSKKERNWFLKLTAKSMKDWNKNEIGILSLLYDAHHIPTFSVGGLSISNDDTAENLWRKKFKAANEMLNELFSKDI